MKRKYIYIFLIIIIAIIGAVSIGSLVQDDEQKKPPIEKNVENEKSDDLDEKLDQTLENEDIEISIDDVITNDSDETVQQESNKTPEEKPVETPEEKPEEKPEVTPDNPVEDEPDESESVFGESGVELPELPLQ